MGVSDMLIWMFRFKQNRHFNPLGGSLLKMCVFWWGRLVQQMLAGLCKPLRWYAPATTRREPVPGGSLMSSLTSNGRVRGVPAQRQKLGSCWWFFFQRLGVCRRAGGAGLCRPSVFRDENRELTGMYLQRVGMALHPSTTWQGFAAGTYQRGGWYIYAKRFGQGGGTGCK